MADVITRFKLETTQFDSKLRDTAKALKDVTHQASLGGKDFDNFSQKAIESARALGTVQSGANNTKDKLRDLVGSYNDAAKAYNELTDKAKQGEFGKAMSASLQQLQQRIRETKEELYGLGDEMKGASGGGLFGGGKLDGMLQVFGGNVMTKIAGAGLNFASELGDMVKQGIELARAGEGVRIAFQRLGRGDLLDGLRQATHGTVTDLELMKAAVKFNDFKLPLDELGTMLAFAQQKAKDTGQSVDYMVDSIVTGLGRKSLMILDNLGLSAAEVKEKMAETGDMTKAVGAIIREQMSKAGDYVETAADRATKANVELENAMTRLGETFQPLTDAANDMWTSIKVGALDLISKAVQPLIDKLTEAGRLRAQLNNINAGTGTEQTRAGKDLNTLKNAAQRYGGTDAKVEDLYNRQRARYIQQQNQAWRQSQAARQRYDQLRHDGGSQADLNAYYQRWQTMEAQAKAWANVLKEYDEGAKKIMNPVKADIETDEAEQNVASLTKKLKELQAQRKKAIAAGDTDLSKNLLKQINQTKADIKGLGGGGTTTTTHQTKQQRAQETFTKAEQNYKQALEQAAMELEAGTITRAEAKKKEMQAAEQRWKAIGDARNISDSPELKQAQDEAAANYKALAAEVKTATEQQKAIDKATRELEQAQKKQTEALDAMVKAAQTNDIASFYKAQKQYIAAGGTASTGMNATATESNISAFIGNLKQQISQADLGSELYNNLTAQLSDATLFGNLMQTAIKNGIDVAEFNPQELWSKVFGDNPGDYISNEDWLKKLGVISQKTGRKLQFNPQTGEIRETPKKENGGDLEKFSKDFSAITGSVNGILSGIQNLGIEIPEGLAKTLGVIQTISGILTAILAISTAIQATSAANATANWVDAIIPFAKGGIVHAANGYVDGNTYSGDQIPAMLNAGEVVLNRSQQGVLAASLQAVGQSGEGSGDGKPYVSGEMIWLGLTNYLNRSGRGEIVTSKRR